MTSQPQTEDLIDEMVSYFAGDPKRIQHFLKVHALARVIGVQEGLPQDELYVLETAAVVHDIGIKQAEAEHGYNTGKMQEHYGPIAAKPLLERMGYSPNVIERVLFLVGHHHTYRDIQGTDYQILVEADFLVNLYEDNMSEKAIRNAYERIFCTESGKRLCREMFGLATEN